MAFNQQEQDIIKYGLANGKTKEQVTQALTNLRTGVIPPKKEVATPSFLQRAGEDVSEAGSKIVDILSAENQKSLLNKGMEATATAFNVIPKVGYEALPQQARQVLDVVGKGIETGAGWLINKISDNPQLQKWTQDNPQAFTQLTDALGTVSSAGQIAGDILLADQTTKALQGGVNLTKQGIEKGTQVVKQGVEKVSSKISDLTNKAPADIMQRVARIPKGAQAKFENLAGESVGEYLTKRNIFGNVEDVTSKLYNRFTKSKTTADKALETLKGTFEPEPVKTMVSDLLKRELEVSTPGAPSPILGEVQKLASKIGREGWTMSEINQIKRLFERNVKVDYLKTMNPKGVAQATNLDSAVRNWQFSQAETLGLKNLPAINKETMLAKNLMDSLGKEYAGSAGNNAISLTDWIMLSGGDPASIAGFLVKKGFSSKEVQSAIAKYINKGKPTMGEVQADLGVSQVKQLPAPKVGSPKSSINVPINQPSRRAIAQGTEIVTPSKKILPQSPTKLSQTYKNNVSQTIKKVNALPKTTINETIERAITSAEQTLETLPKSEIAKLGGIGKLIEITRKNIVDELKGKGLTDMANKINKIKLNSLRSIDDLDTAILNVTERL